METLIEQFVTLWVVIDPIGTIPVYVAATAGFEPRERSLVAFHATLAAAGVLMFFLVLGQFLIDALGISLVAFQVSGGLVLFLFALTMIFGESKMQAEIKDAKTALKEGTPAVFPIAVPSLAGPGAMLAVVLLTDNNRFSMPEQAVTAGLMLLVILCSLLLMLAAGPILKVIKVTTCPSRVLRAKRGVNFLGLARSTVVPVVRFPA